MKKKMNNEEFKVFIKNNLGEEYEVLSDNFKNTNSRITMKHLVCNNEYEVFAHNILKEKPTKCPFCFGHRRKTLEEIKETFKNFKNGEYEVIKGDYKNIKSILTFRHTKCGKLFDGSVNSILNNNKKCPHCNPYRVLTNEEFKDKIKNLTNNEFEVLGEYINSETKIKIKHNTCNKEFMVTPSNFIKKKNKCPYCNKNNKKNTDIFKFEVEKMYGDEYTVIGEYINNYTKIKMRHNICGNEYLVNPSNFSLGDKCPICNRNKQKLTTDEFKKRVFKLVKKEYTVLGEYVNYNTKIKMRHNICGNEFEMSPSHFLNGERCTKCRTYKGEEKIRRFLEKNNLDFKEQFSFKDLYYKSKNHPLKFDFKLEYEDGNLLLIEFDGRQHFEEWYYEGLSDIQKRDKLKNEYCKKHNYELLRISYKDFNNIEKILEDYLIIE